MIRQVMEGLMAGRTAIVIAHRLPTVRPLDHVPVFAAGRNLPTVKGASIAACSNRRLKIAQSTA